MLGTTKVPLLTHTRCSKIDVSICSHTHSQWPLLGLFSQMQNVRQINKCRRAKEKQKTITETTTTSKSCLVLNDRTLSILWRTKYRKEAMRCDTLYGRHDSLRWRGQHHFFCLSGSEFIHMAVFVCVCVCPGERQETIEMRSMSIGRDWMNGKNGIDCCCCCCCFVYRYWCDDCGEQKKKVLSTIWSRWFEFIEKHLSVTSIHRTFPFPWFFFSHSARECVRRAHSKATICAHTLNSNWLHLEWRGEYIKKSLSKRFTETKNRMHPNV